MQSRGFEICRGAVPPDLCKTMRRVALADAECVRNPNVYNKVVNFMTRNTGFSLSPSRPIRSPHHRVHVSLELDVDSRKVLTLAATYLRESGVLERSKMNLESAKLVELSAMISFPGAQCQIAHTDVPPFSDGPRVFTLWVALQDIDLSMGPTMIHTCSPELLRSRVDWDEVEHQSLLRETTTPKFYASDGSSENDELEKIQSTDSGWTLDDLNLPTARAIELSEGDISLMDGRFFHYGSANVSQVPRVLFSASFEDKKEHQSDSGFTYELRSNLVGRYSLNDFVCIE
jgi:hypothetical protein